jgi:hypothetical protein
VYGIQIRKGNTALEHYVINSSQDPLDFPESRNSDRGTCSALDFSGSFSIASRYSYYETQHARSIGVIGMVSAIVSRILSGTDFLKRLRTAADVGSGRYCIRI